MLRFLAVQNLAVIEALDLEFEPGLTVLTGETGAGKSILVGAVGLLLGGRASPDLIRTGEENATVQAVFERPPSLILQPTLDEGSQEVLVRREITTQGRSRAFVDGALATAGALKDLTATLVDLHGQHDHQALLDPHTHLDLLDAYAGLEADREAVRHAFAEWQDARARLERLRIDERRKAERQDLLTFQLGELDRAALRTGEDEELAATRQVLASAEKLQRLASEAYGQLYESDEAALPALAGVWRRVGELAAIDARFVPYLESRDAIKSQLEDLASFLRGYADTLDAGPARLQEVEDRLALVERLKRKYGPTLDDVLARRAELVREMTDLEEAGERAAELEERIGQLTDRYLTFARALSCGRREAAPRLARALEEQLADLAMERTRFEVRFNASEPAEPEWADRGIDEAEFYVSPNPGEDLRPLARIVSGGELSRLMLALKTVASTDHAGKTLVFDEVDAGIGGRVADAVGRKLRALAGRFQVLCITHLPQIAAYGSTHFRITKVVRDGRTLTRVERMAGEERVGELARMIGGMTVTEQTVASAREMLATRQGESEYKAKGESPIGGESERRKRKEKRR